MLTGPDEARVKSYKQRAEELESYVEECKNTINKLMIENHHLKECYSAGNLQRAEELEKPTRVSPQVAQHENSNTAKERRQMEETLREFQSVQQSIEGLLHSDRETLREFQGALAFLPRKGVVKSVLTVVSKTISLADRAKNINARLNVALLDIIKSHKGLDNQSKAIAQRSSTTLWQKISPSPELKQNGGSAVDELDTLEEDGVTNRKDQRTGKVNSGLGVMRRLYFAMEDADWKEVAVACRMRYQKEEGISRDVGAQCDLDFNEGPLRTSMEVVAHRRDEHWFKKHCVSTLSLEGIHKAMVVQAYANVTVRFNDGHDSQWLDVNREHPNNGHPFGLGWLVAKHVLFNEKL